MVNAGRFILTSGLIFVIAATAGCSRALPNRDPTGDLFPSVIGESLEEERIELPGALADEPAVLLIGYKSELCVRLDR